MILAYTVVADPDLQIRMGGGGGWSFKPGDKGGRCQTKFFPRFRLKIRGGGGGGLGPSGPSPESATTL